MTEAMIAMGLTYCFCITYMCIESSRRTAFWMGEWRKEIRARHLAEDDRHRMILELTKKDESP